MTRGSDNPKVYSISKTPLLTKDRSIASLKPVGNYQSLI